MKKLTKVESEEMKQFFNRYTECIYFNDKSEECLKIIDIYENQLFTQHPSDWYPIIHANQNKTNQIQTGYTKNKS